MNEAFHIAELKFDSRSDIIEPDNTRVLRDDKETALDLARAVVGKLQNEKILENGLRRRGYELRWATKEPKAA
jgi:hypothetical protein